MSIASLPLSHAGPGSAGQTPLECLSDPPAAACPANKPPLRPPIGSSPRNTTPPGIFSLPCAAPLRGSRIQNSPCFPSLPRPGTLHLDHNQPGIPFRAETSEPNRPAESSRPGTGRASRAAIRKPAVIVIHQRAFFRDCFVRCLEASYKNQDIFAYSSFAEWRGAVEPAAPLPAVVVVFLDSSRASSTGDFSFLDATTGTPVVVVSDIDDANFIVTVMKHGVRGYIPTSLPLNVAVEAVRLVQAGGTFVPPCALERDWSKRDGATKAGDLLTERQMRVAEALCQGMANKQIAYALQMSEHTVKIHLRHIMRKLNARNRTEVAILANAILNGWDLRPASS